MGKDTEISSKGVKAKDVASFLESNSDFFIKHQNLLEKIVLPSFEDRKVSSISEFQIKKMKKRLDLLEDRNKLLVQTSIQNLESQKQINKLVLKLLNASTIKGLKGTLSKEFKNNLNLDSVNLYLAEKDIPAKEIKSKFNGGVARLQSLSKDSDKSLHGKGGEEILSEALLLLKAKNGVILGLLAIGSTNRQRFHEGQGADLLEFLSEVLAHCLERCASNK